MSATVLPELAAESAETAERLVALSARAGLDAAEAEYLLVSGLAAIQRIPRLWPIVRSRIGSETTGAATYELLARLVAVVDKNLTLAETLKEPARLVREKLGHEPELTAALTAAEERLREIRAEAVGLLKVVDAPGPGPAHDQPKGQINETAAHRGGTVAAGDFPTVGTPEWGRMNQRRGELIRKKNRMGLSPDEQVEYERLQRLSHEALEDRFPRPFLHSDAGEGRR